jgi:hypothetical protein
MGIFPWQMALLVVGAWVTGFLSVPRFDGMIGND